MSDTSMDGVAQCPNCGECAVPSQKPRESRSEAENTWRCSNTGCAVPWFDSDRDVGTDTERSEGSE